MLLELTATYNTSIVDVQKTNKNENVSIDDIAE